MADTDRRGRAFLAGDAAHLNSPVGGQGMNVGILDALDLGDRLVAVLAGRAKEEILDGYEAVRWRTEAAPLAVVASSFGVINAFYFSFAVDAVAEAGELPRAIVGGILFAVIGAAGFVGLFTGAGVARFALGRVLTVTLAWLGVASLLIGVAPGHLPSAIVSAALFGAGVMVMSALLSIWSSSVFAEQPTAGFSAALFVFGVGLVAGPAVLGALAGVHGLATSFLVAAALMLPTMIAQPRHGDRPSRDLTS